ncbi:MAG: hypothetical protein ACLTMP_08525 [Eggerthella lenta]
MREADAPACEDGTVAGARAPGPLLPWLPSIPLFFLGLGVYRAWIEIVFRARSSSSPQLLSRVTTRLIS